MSKKKLMWIFILMVFIIAVITIAVLAKPRDTSNDNAINTKRATGNDSTDLLKVEEKKDEVEYEKNIIDDGILYSKNGEKVSSDVKIGTEYFDTTINDMYLYPENYYGKKIEIEGMYLEAYPYTFVGRYSANSVCQYCSGGFSYIEYEFDGNIQEDLIEQETWIKLIGTWEKEKMNYGTEENPIYEEYYYLKVLSFEIMNEKGETTVKN